jgi:hypothetical protein
MTRRFLVLSLSVLLVAGSAAARNIDDFRNATPEELAMKSAPMAPGAAAVILDWVQRKDDVDFQESAYVRVKIFTDDGRQDLRRASQPEGQQERG